MKKLKISKAVIKKLMPVNVGGKYFRSFIASYNNGRWILGLKQKKCLLGFLPQIYRPETTYTEIFFKRGKISVNGYLY